ncbi:hypothetical protein XM38_022060 [Halomicronema hongdechloris C2206]|uniref:Uncharacterized protein n=1 Tax=Halomicronema hongdechloris C2206 TaxID=1641165 RepID=A0A1Z3HLT2_9CYAN|nr:hypothetical protein XM38_022060 [Halomicronema hongdechloris C2206]
MLSLVVINLSNVLLPLRKSHLKIGPDKVDERFRRNQWDFDESVLENAELEPRLSKGSGNLPPTASEIW